MRVLVVEDELRLAENIAAGLREGLGYAVDVSHDGERALEFCATVAYDLLVLDLMLPKKGGEEIVRAVRGGGADTPILILTAVDVTQSKIDLLDLGADDYLTKPFDLGEFLARARALVRRGKGAARPVLEHAGLTLRTNEQTVYFQKNQTGLQKNQTGSQSSQTGFQGDQTGFEDSPIELSPTEYRILEYLMFRPRYVISKRELLQHLYDFTWEHHSNVIEAHVSNLRRKLRLRTGADLVETLRGRGYRLLSGGG